MRLTRVFALAACIGVAMTVCALYATFSAIARVSGGGYGPTPVRDFAIEYFWLWGPALIAIGSLGWIVARLWPRRIRSDDSDAP